MTDVELNHSAKRPEGKRFVFIFATNQSAGAGGQSSGFEFQVQQEELIKFQRRRSGNLWSGETVSLDDNGEGIWLTSVTCCWWSLGNKHPQTAVLTPLKPGKGQESLRNAQYSHSELFDGVSCFTSVENNMTPTRF